MPCDTLKEVLCPNPQLQKSLYYSLPGGPEISPPWKNWLRPFTPYTHLITVIYWFSGV
jgi:hypothetical protein